MFNGSTNHISRYKDRLSLLKSNRPCNSLILHAWIPLWLDNEYTIGRSKVEAISSQRKVKSKSTQFVPESASASCHYENWYVGTCGEVFEDCLATGESTFPDIS